MEKKPPPQRIAVVGSGLAGLTAAHILHSASRSVTIFEQAAELSFDSASVSVGTPSSSPGTPGPVERIDLPMRAVAGGYYQNVVRLYAHLGIPLHPVRFLFVFAEALGLAPARDPEAGHRAYFVHASNLHRIPPRPGSRGRVRHAFEVLLLIVCHLWFTAACFLVPPATKPFPRDAGRAAEQGEGEAEEEEESLGEYVRRIRLPRRYVSHYLLPLMSSVATCSHDEMLAFPARDVVEYKRRSHGQQHYVVCGGVRRVQDRLVQGIADVRLSARVVRVQPAPGGVGVRWRAAPSCPGAGEAADRESCEEQEEVFDRVILAVSPDVAGRIFSPVRALAGRIPTRRVESTVLCPAGCPARAVAVVVVEEEDSRDPDTRNAARCAHHASGGSQAQVITFRTRFAGGEPSTEALHAMPSGVLVQTCPLQESGGSQPGALKTARFTRTLRTTESQRAVRRMMTMKAPSGTRGTRTEGQAEGEGDGEWTNGQDGVWLVGAWCWDGMVLLEGCVVSAMRAARDMGADVPWDR